MKGARGAANLARYNEKVMSLTVLKLDQFITECKQDRKQFKSLNELIAAASTFVGVHRTNLKRNARYAEKLQKYLNEQGGGIEVIDERTADRATLLIKLRATEARVGRLEAEIQRLRLDAPSPKTVRTTAIEGGSEVGHVAMALCLTLERVSDIMKLDFAEQAIVDLAARPSERVVAGPERVRSLIRWISLNQGLLRAANLQYEPSQPKPLGQA